MQPEYVIEVSNLMKKYEDLVAVDHINFQVPRNTRSARFILERALKFVFV